ncbi:MAG TPA: hypothetical protein VH592_04475 [Gemmataceae bacterium]
MKFSRFTGLACLWLGITVGYCWLHSFVDYVWDDSPKVCAIHYDYPDHADLCNRQTILARSFGAECRPLHNLQEYISYYLYAHAQIDPMPWYAIGGAALGLLAVATYLVARRFTQSTAGALLAVFLLLFSTPIITGSWPVIFSIQAIVPLSICLGFLAYWRAVEAHGRAGQIGWTVALVIVMFLAPWYREFAGLLPLLVLWLEVKRVRRPTWIMVLAAGCFLHAVYPTALLTWLFFPDHPIKSVFSTGHLVEVLDSSQALPWWKRHLQGLKWEVPGQFLVLFPPLLLLLALLGYGTRAAQRVFSPAPKDDKKIPKDELTGHGIWVVAASFLRGREAFLRRLCRAAIPVAFLGMGIAVLVTKTVGLWGTCYLILGVTLIAWQADSLLAIWFLLSFLPFLKVFTEQVHLGYAVLPASIGIGCAIEHLIGTLVCLRGRLPVLRYSAIAVLTIALADHALNLYGSFQVVTGIDRSIHQVADWFRANVPAGSIVVGNALHLQDIRLASGGHFETYWTVGFGIPHNESDLSDPARLQALLERKKGAVPVYFLDMEYPYLPWKTVHAHKYVRNRSVERERIGKIGVLCVRYPYLDPFKALILRQFVSFLSGPDLENDFYHGAALDGSLFLREVSVEYHVYRVTGTPVAPSSYQPSEPSVFSSSDSSAASPPASQKPQPPLMQIPNK